MALHLIKEEAPVFLMSNLTKRSLSRHRVQALPPPRHIPLPRCGAGNRATKPQASSLLDGLAKCSFPCLVLLCLQKRRNAKEGEAETSNSQSRFSSNSRKDSPKRSAWRRKTCNTRDGQYVRTEAARRDALQAHEEEEDDEEAVRREAIGFAALHEGFVFYRTYTTTELIDSGTKQRGRKTQFKVGDFVDLMVAREKSKSQNILYRFAQIMAIFQKEPSDFAIPDASKASTFSSSSLEGSVAVKGRRRQSQNGRNAPVHPIKLEVRWVYDAQDLQQMGVSTARTPPLEPHEYAESDKCEEVPAEWLDEEALVVQSESDFLKEKQRRAALEREEEEHQEYFPPLCFLTRFYCSRTNIVMPLEAVGDDREKICVAGCGSSPLVLQLLLNCSKYHQVYVHGGGEDGGSLDAGLTPVQRAIRRLQLDSVPATLPCRMAEFQKVRQTILTGIKQQQGGELLYISGLPGTGKTATVQSVLRSLQRDVQKQVIPPFTCIELNAMRLQHPDMVFVALYKQLFGCKPHSTQHAFAELDRTFTGEAHSEARGQWDDFRKRRLKASKTRNDKLPIVLVVDEVDCLVSVKQRVLYTLFDWPFCPASRLVLIAIANTIDLPEKILNSRCASRIGFGRLTFNPYTSEQIEGIIVERLQDCRDLFADAAIKVCARKIANFYGDIRRALQVLSLRTSTAQPTTYLTRLLLYCLLRQQRHLDCGVPLRSLVAAYQTLLDVGKGSLTGADQLPAGENRHIVDFEDIKAMLDSDAYVLAVSLRCLCLVDDIQLAGMRVIEVYLHLPRIDTQSPAATADKKNRPTVHTAGGIKALLVDPIIDEAGGDTEVAIIAPASTAASRTAVDSVDELVSVFLRDEDLEGLPL
ncbi:AAA family protein [Cyclospora cayetanensis]|uniref:Origin recognition complex subunit 1 n=1 Tax=Cyclospora cayetanensis TaxID=88456 RepID=A0A1D3D3S2_9EIME|nr:AAA family protein [Cyclospora cayetanensis]